MVNGSIHINKVHADMDATIRELCNAENRSRRALVLILIEAALMSFQRSGFNSLTDWRNSLNKEAIRGRKHE